jgi:hypothetical protein
MQTLRLSGTSLLTIACAGALMLAAVSGPTAPAQPQSPMHRNYPHPVVQDAFYRRYDDVQPLDARWVERATGQSAARESMREPKTSNASP